MVFTVQVPIPGADKKTLCIDVKSDTTSQLFMLIEQQCRKSKGWDNPLVWLREPQLCDFSNRFTF